METDIARNAAMMLRWAAETLRDYATLKQHEVHGVDHKLILVGNQLTGAAELLGFTVTRTPSPDQAAHERMLAIRSAEGCQEAELYRGASINAGPDDGLQHDERGHLVGGR